MEPPHAEWFAGGKLNALFELPGSASRKRANRAALIWEGEPGEVYDMDLSSASFRSGAFHGCFATIRSPSRGSRGHLHADDSRSVVAMLSSARGGFTHTVIFVVSAGEALRDRINDAGVKVLDHRRCGIPKGRNGSSQAKRRPRRRSVPFGETRDRGSSCGCWKAHASI